MGGVEKRTERRHQEDQAPARHSRPEGLGIPGKKSDGLDGRQIQKAALHAPVDARGGIARCHILPE